VEGTLGTDVTWKRKNKPNVSHKNVRNKLGIVADVFDRERYDILITRGMYQPFWVGVPPVNLGKVQNKGYEIEVSYNGSIHNVNYSVRGNISVAKIKFIPG